LPFLDFRSSIAAGSACRPRAVPSGRCLRPAPARSRSRRPTRSNKTNQAKAKRKAAQAAARRYGRGRQADPAAIELLKSKKGKEALGKVREAQAVGDRTPYENYLVERVLGQAAATAGEPAIAARAFENVATSPTSPRGKRSFSQRRQPVLLVKNYAKTTELARATSRKAARKSRSHDLRPGAVPRQRLRERGQGADEDLEARNGEQGAREEQLQLLASSARKTKDAACYGKAMEMLVAYYPKREYCSASFTPLRRVPGFPSGSRSTWLRLKIETARCAARRSTSTQRSSRSRKDSRMERSDIDNGYASGVLGTGPKPHVTTAPEGHGGEEPRRGQEKALAREESQSGAAKDGRALFNEGFNYVCSASRNRPRADGEGDSRRKSLQAAGTREAPAGVRLPSCGPESEAIQILKTVQGADGAAALARLWATVERAS